MGQVNLNQEICAKRFHLFSKLATQYRTKYNFCSLEGTGKVFSFFLDRYTPPSDLRYGYLLSRVKVTTS